MRVGARADDVAASSSTCSGPSGDLKAAATTLPSASRRRASGERVATASASPSTPRRRHLRVAASSSRSAATRCFGRAPAGPRGPSPTCDPRRRRSRRASSSSRSTRASSGRGGRHATAAAAPTARGAVTAAHRSSPTASTRRPRRAASCRGAHPRGVAATRAGLKVRMPVAAAERALACERPRVRPPVEARQAHRPRVDPLLAAVLARRRRRRGRRAASVPGAARPPRRRRRRRHHLAARVAQRLRGGAVLGQGDAGPFLRRGLSRRTRRSGMEASSSTMAVAEFQGEFFEERDLESFGASCHVPSTSRPSSAPKRRRRAPSPSSTSSTSKPWRPRCRSPSCVGRRRRDPPENTTTPSSRVAPRARRARHGMCSPSEASPRLAQSDTAAASACRSERYLP